jgi:LysM repeat protein
VRADFMTAVQLPKNTIASLAPKCPGILPGVKVLFALIVVLGWVLSLPAQSRAAVPVAQHDLRCDANFPCHDDIRRRTDFWIQVYNKWTTRQGVFHDSLHPERVYSVIEVPDGCRGSSSSVERERDRIKAELAALSRKLRSGSAIRDPREVALLDLFPDRSAASVAEASERIRCQQGNRDRFEAALRRYGAYGPIVRSLLAESDLPMDIQYLPFVESLYSPGSYSRVGAAGMWQIMPQTARYLGMQIDATVDERLDVEASTLGAIRYLKDARNRLTAVAREKKPSVRPGEMGPFIITSYNYGVNGMRRALQAHGPDYIAVLNNHRSPSFQVAVKNFYASFLAARYVAGNAERYFGKIQADPELRYHTVVLKHDTSMSRIVDVFGVTEEELRPLNRALTRFVWNGWRLAPKGYRLHLPYAAHGWRTQIARLEALAPEDGTRGPVRYTVRSGDTACGIARAFHVQCKDLIDMNSLGSRALIRVGQEIAIPGRAGIRQTVSAPTASSASLGSTTGYRVRPGDSPCGIARRAGVACNALLAANSLNSRSVIHPGQVLRLPGRADSNARQVASNANASGQSTMLPSSYTVKPRDTACEIAERFQVPCAEFMRLNGLGVNSILRVGQQLRLSASSAPSEDGGGGQSRVADREAAYSVQPGDTPCQIAERHGMSCGAFQRLNNLRPQGVIYVGQVLKVIASAGQVENMEASSIESGREPLPDAAGDALSSPLDADLGLDIVIRSEQGARRYLIRVEPDETLGHYADWLGIGSVGPIKTLNRMNDEQPLVIGEELLLPATADEQIHRFNLKRIDYHRVLVEEFKENFNVTTVDSYRVRNGDSAWTIAGRLQLPLWLLTRYNPELRMRHPRAGEMLSAAPAARPPGPCRVGVEIHQDHVGAGDHALGGDVE